MSHHSAQAGTKGLLASLFDLDFTSFITLRFLKVIYILVMVLTALVGLGLLISGLSQGGRAALATLIIVPIAALFYLVLARVSLEIIAILFRIADDTAVMAGRTGPEPGAGSGPGGPPAPSAPDAPPPAPPAGGYGGQPSGWSSPTQPGYGNQPGYGTQAPGQPGSQPGSQSGGWAPPPAS